MGKVLYAPPPIRHLAREDRRITPLFVFPPTGQSFRGSYALLTAPTAISLFWPAKPALSPAS